MRDGRSTASGGRPRDEGEVTVGYDPLDYILLLAGVAAYLGACGVAVRHALLHKDVQGSLWKVLVALGWLACVGFLVSAGVRREACPVVNRMEAMAFTTSLLVLVCALLDFSFRMRGLTAVAVPIASALLGGAVALGESGPTGAPAQRHWLYLHISLLLMSYAALSIAFLGGVLFLYQERQLKSKRFGLLFHRLPALDATDRMTARALVFGFPLLTLGILFGGVSAHARGVLGTAWFGDPKVILSIFTWIVYLVVLALRLNVKYGGRRVAYLAVLGFGFLAFTVLGANLVGRGFHRW